MDHNNKTNDELEELLKNNPKDLRPIQKMIKHYDNQNNGENVKKYLLQIFNSPMMARYDIIIFLKYASPIELYLGINNENKKYMFNAFNESMQNIIEKYIETMEIRLCISCYMETMCGKYNDQLICATCCPIIDGETIVSGDNSWIFVV